MIMIDLEPYPEHTDQLLEALRWFHDENNTEATTFRRIAGECPDLNKDQVRYRVFDHLLEDDYLTLNWVDEHNQAVAYVGPCEDALETARAREKTIELLGEVPDDPTKDDILKLVNHLRALQTGIDIGKMPDFIQNQSQNTDRIQDLENQIEDLEGKIEHADSYKNSTTSSSNQRDNIEDRLTTIENNMGLNSNYGDKISFSDFLKIKTYLKWHHQDLKHLSKKADAGYFNVLDEDNEFYF